MIKKILLFHFILFSISNIFGQNSLDFDGTDDKIDCGYDTSVQITGKNITLEAWIYPTAWKTNVYEGNIINREYNVSNYGYMLRCGAGGKLNFGIGDGTWREITSTNTVLSLNTWQHVAGTYDGSKMRLYLNGVIIDSLSIAISIKSFATQPLEIGFHSGYTRFYQGGIDEVRIWNITLTDAQIAANMNKEYCSAQKGLRAYYKFNQGVASNTNSTIKTLVDISGYKNNGTLSNFNLSGTGSNWVSGKTLTKSVTNSTFNVTICDAYKSPSKKYTWKNSGSYYDTIPTTFDCDSVININLKIKKSSTNTINVRACKSYTSPSGKYTWTTNGIYTDYLKNWIGCDSIITIKLKIGADIGNLAITICKKYKSPSGKYIWTSSGNYTDTVKSYLGCDSIIMINLTILGPKSGKKTVFVCHSYTSPSGKYTYTQTGGYYDTISTNNGCDSIILIIVYIKSTYTAFSKSVCNSYTSPSGKIYLQSGNYYDTIPNKFGCDSIIYMQLIINKSSRSTIFINTCKNYVLPSKKLTLYKDGIYYDTIRNKSGCDSFMQIHLRIIKLNKTVSISGSTLTSQPIGISYQWLNCNANFSVIPGATARSYTPDVNGDYAVEIKDSGCVDTSKCIAVKNLNVFNLISQPKIRIWPHPNNGAFNIDGLPYDSPFTIRIYDLKGSLLIEKLQYTKNVNIELPAEMYILNIIQLDKIFMQTLRIE